MLRSRLLFLLIISSLLITLVPTVTAQDEGLTEEEQALLTRVGEAVVAIRGYSSYRTVVTTDEMQDISINIAGTTQMSTSSTTSVVEATVVNGDTDNPNVSGTATATVQENDGTTDTSYTINTEFRLVDGTLYLNSAYADDASGPEPLPEGWTEVEDLEGLSALANLNLDNVLNQFMTEVDEEDMSNILNAIQQIATSATSITESEAEIDGTTYTAITIAFDWTGLRDLILQEGGIDPADPMVGIFDTLEGDIGTITVYLDENDQAAGYQLNFSLNLQDVDLSEVSADIPAGTTFSMLMTAQQVAMLSDINADFEPATAPE